MPKQSCSNAYKKLLPCLNKVTATPKKIAEPANAVLPFPFRPPAAPVHHITFISLPFCMSFRPQLPPYIPTNSVKRNGVKNTVSLFLIFFPS